MPNLRAGGEHPSDTIPVAPLRWAGFAVALAAIVMYASSVRYGFVWDDFNQIVDNRWLRDPRFLKTIFSSDSWMMEARPSGFYRPLLQTAYLLLFQAFGPAPAAFHAASVLLHAVNSALVVLVVRQVQRDSGAGRQSGQRLSLIAGLIFAVHPVNVDAVAWIAGMDNLLYVCFGLLAFLAHRREGPLGGATAALLLALALFSKESALVILPLFVLHDVCMGRYPDTIARWARTPRYWLYATVTGGYLLVRSWALGKGVTTATETGISWRSLFLDGPVLMMLNLRRLVFPYPLPVWAEYTTVRGLSEIRFLVAAAILGGLGVVAWRLAKRFRLGFLGLSLIILPLSTVTYLPAIGQALGNRRLYLPSVGLGVLVAAWLFMRRPGSSFLSRHGMGIGIVIACALGAYTLFLMPTYTDNLTFWRAAVRQSLGSWLPHLQLGIELTSARQANEGIAELKRAQTISPTDPMAHFHLGNAYQGLGMGEQALAEYRAALAVDPAHIPSLYNISVMESEAGHDRAALTLLQQAARLAPDNALVRNRLGIELVLDGSVAAGTAELAAAVDLMPWDEEFRRSLELARALPKKLDAPNAADALSTIRTRLESLTPR